MTKLTAAGSDFILQGVRRGDYMTVAGRQYAMAAGGRAEGYVTSNQRTRVTAASASVLTVREVHSLRAVEWFHRRTEDWIAWPLADLNAKLRVRS